MLDQEKQQRVLQVVRFGCDAATACDFVDCTPQDLQQALADDDCFHREYRRAAAAAEVHRMKVINEAADDVKNWRAATWWFERRDGVRLDRQDWARATDQLQQALGEATALVRQHIADPQRQEELCLRLAQIESQLTSLAAGPSPRKRKKKRPS